MWCSVVMKISELREERLECVRVSLCMCLCLSGEGGDIHKVYKRA